MLMKLWFDKSLTQPKNGVYTDMLLKSTDVLEISTLLTASPGLHEVLLHILLIGKHPNSVPSYFSMEFHAYGVLWMRNISNTFYFWLRPSGY